jgi:general secretion pathway protein L
MANRLIGLELGTEGVRIAILRRDKGGVAVIALEERPGGNVVEQVAAVAALPGVTFGLGDRLAAALPAGRAYVRTLHFPFKDRRKIQAAAPFELAAQLPVAMESCTTALLWSKAAAEGSEVIAAAVPTAAVSEQLAPFEAATIPLHILDLMPFGLVAGLADRLGSAILVCVTGMETTISRVDTGRLREHRLIPGPVAPHNPLAVSQLLRECQALQHRGAGDEWPVYLTGAGATPELLEALRSRGLSATTLSLTLGGKLIAPAFVPAVALALRAASHQSEHSFNLRQGPFAYRGELRAVRRAAATAVALLVMSLLVLGAAAFINYRDRARQAEALQREMVQMYQAAFPGSTLTVDVALQMDSKLRELRSGAEALGIASQPPPRRILRQLAELPAQVQIEVEEFYCGSEEIRLTGTTDTFEAVNKIRDLLARSTLFSSVEVAESRKSLDGGRVNFRLRLPLAVKGATP